MQAVSKIIWYAIVAGYCGCGIALPNPVIMFPLTVHILQLVLHVFELIVHFSQFSVSQSAWI